MNIIHLEAIQFEVFTRKISKEKMRRFIGKPKHKSDMIPQSASFLGHQEDKKFAWCLN